VETIIVNQFFNGATWLFPSKIEELKAVLTKMKISWHFTDGMTQHLQLRIDPNDFPNENINDIIFTLGIIVGNIMSNS
jgi:hypothetical protein